jgi:hypothetical protein
VTVTNVSAGQSVTKAGAFEISATKPTVTGVSAPLVQGNTNQQIEIFGTGFQAPPPDLGVVFLRGGVPVAEVKAMGVSFTDPTKITAIVTTVTDAGQKASLGSYDVAVINPDGGAGMAANAVEVRDPVDEGGDAPPSKNTTTTVTTSPPAITSLTPASGPLGGSVVIAGARFGATAGSNAVTFAGAGGIRVAATVTAVTSSSLTVTVPPQAVTGSVTVAVNGLLSNAVPFMVTTPVLGGVVPPSVTTDPGVARQVTLTLGGSRFLPGASVRFGGPATDIVPVGGPTVSADGGTITLIVSIGPGPQQVGPRDVTVTNAGTCPSTLPGCLSSTLAGGLQIQLPPAAGFSLSLPDFPDTSAYLPDVAGVSLTRLPTGACDPTTKVVTPKALRLQARFVTTTGLAPPASVTFTLASSAIPGTATNENCELDPAKPTPDFSVGQASPAAQQVVVPDSGGGLYQTTLHSYDRGGKVTITVTGVTGGVAATGSLLLPVDADGDDLPDVYEKQTGVLDFQKLDQNGNGVKDRDDRFARDGLSNFEKYRGVYLVGPAPGQSGDFSGFERLGAGARHLFVRGRGFRDDPAVPAGFCGINATTGAPVEDPTLSTANPCPAFQLGKAFASIAVAVHDVTGSFTAATELPRVSLVNPAQPTLDMATVIYDATACKGSEACNTTSKFGVRQWGYSTLGYTPAYGTATTYGTAFVFKRAVESYFNNRPYQARTNDPARVVRAPDGTRMLAPITIVGDSGSTGTDNGKVDSGEATINGELAGDTYVPGSFAQQLSALDVNTDGCVELPTVADPTTIARCVPGASAATAPSATKQQVVRSISTHELGHAVGISTHTSDRTDVMYLSTINFTREDSFSSLAAGLVQIHNKGLQ